MKEIKEAVEIIKELKCMIYKSKSPQMDGSHILDERLAEKRLTNLYLIIKDIQERYLAVETKMPEKMVYKSNDYSQAVTRGFNQAIDECTLRVTKMLDRDKIIEVIDQVYDCDHNGSSYIANWGTVADAIIKALPELIKGELWK